MERSSKHCWLAGGCLNIILYKSVKITHHTHTSERRENRRIDLCTESGTLVRIRYSIASSLIPMGKKSKRPQRQHHQQQHPKTKPSKTSTGTTATTSSTMGTSASTAAATATPGDAESEVLTEAAAPAKEEEVTTTADTGVEEGTAKHVIPEGLTAFLPQLTESQKQLALELCSEGQEHLFEGWSSSTTPDKDEDKESKKKIQMMEQLEALDQSYPDGGLKGYVRNARVLLEKSRQGINPLEGWTPSIPRGDTFHLGTTHYDETEAIGIPYLGKCAFVLVAGGLGERLGYGDIKVTCFFIFFKISFNY